MTAGPATTSGPELREPANRVDPRAKLMWRLAAGAQAVATFAVLLLAALVWLPFELTWWLVLILAVVLAVHPVVMPTWRYAVHRWEVTDTAVYTQVGWWTRERRIAPISRIQTVDHAESALERLFGLATVTVTTASAAGALRIPGLARDDALRLSAELTRQAEADTTDAT